MKQHLIVMTALIGLTCAPAFAQTQPTAPTDSKPAAAAAKGNFISEQSSSQWMTSNLIGASVYGPDDKSIGSINDIVLDTSGAAEGAVVGVGGFLGIGEKNVAVPFKDLKVTKKDNGKVDKVMLSMTKEDLKNAPSFMTFAEKQAKADRATTGSTRNPTDPSMPAKKPMQ
jgi:sporulation protein YlmC with PRC-barrel domain